MATKLNPTLPALAPTFITRLAPLGTRTVVKKGTKAYRYRYLRLDMHIFQEVAGAQRIRALITSPDFTVPPVLITARLVKKGRRVLGFTVDAQYQKIVEGYARSGYIAILYIEVVERQKEAGTPGQ